MSNPPSVIARPAPAAQAHATALARDLEAWDNGRDVDLAGLLLGLQGRVSRRTFWCVGIIGLGLLQLYLVALLDIAGASESLADGLPSALVLWPAIAVTAKRWHDRNRSGWWVLINLVPVVGSLWTLLQCGLLKGTRGTNRFGPDPLEARDPMLEAHDDDSRIDEMVSREVVSR
jgi:uncharacterized membrane protein YhaH (DUF805 family)